MLRRPKERTSLLIVRQTQFVENLIFNGFWKPHQCYKGYVTNSVDLIFAMSVVF